MSEIKTESGEKQEKSEAAVNAEPEKLEQKSEEETNKPWSFTEALKEKYCFDCGDYNFGSSQITFHGKAGTGGAKAELAHLRTVVLSQEKLTHAGIPREGLASLCPNVIDLELSCNNLTSWKEIIPIFQQLPHLRFVNLAVNKIKADQGYLEKIDKPMNNVENLVLNYTLIGWQDVLKLTRKLPALKELHVCNNEYEGFGDIRDDDLKNIECFRANNNNITKWSEVWKLRHLPKLQSLILSGNPVKDVFYDHNRCATTENVPDSVAMETQNGYSASDACDNLQCSFKNTNEKPKFSANTCDSHTSADLQELQQECETIVTELLNTAQKTAEIEEKQTNSLPETNRQRYDSIQSEDGDEGGAKLKQTLIDNMTDMVEEDNRQPFQHLHTLCLTETNVHHIDHLEALTKFPSLKSVRLRDIPLFKEHNDEDSWKLFLASLPNIEIFNGSEITDTDRENSERFYIRHYLDHDVKPRRIAELEQKHGKLSKIVDIDIGGNYQEYATLQFYINGKKSFSRRLCMRDSLDKLRSFVANELKTSKRNFRLFHYPCGPGHVYREGEFPEKEKLVTNLPMSRFSMFDGDEIHVETSTQIDEMDVRVVIMEKRK